MNRTRRMLATVLFVALTVALVGVAPTVAQEDCAFRIGLVTDVGRLNDQSFNESAWNAINLAAETLGLPEQCVAYIETQDTADYIPNIELLVNEGYNVIVTSGYLMTEATREAGRMFPDAFFIGTDQNQVNENYEPDPIPNVAGLIFDESVSGFLAGALAASMSETGVVGGVYGTDIVPAVVRFRLGYEMGAAYMNPDIKVLGAYHPGTPDVAFIDQEWGSETAQVMMDEQADVFFGAGGQTGNGALIAACEKGLPVIGVDFDQYITLPEVQPCIMSSATKDLVNGVHNLIVAAYEGTFTGGSVFGPAALAPYHEWEDKIPAEVKTLLEETAAGIAAGEIQTCPYDDPEIGAECWPPGDVLNGGAIVTAQCTVCHDLANIETNMGTQDLEWWQTTVENMLAKEGAPELSQMQKDAILACLHVGDCAFTEQE